MDDFVLPESPFRVEHQQTDALLRRLRPRPEAEVEAMRRIHQRQRGKRLSPEQRREIGASEMDRKEVAAMYGISTDYVTALRRRYSRGELG